MLRLRLLPRPQRGAWARLSTRATEVELDDDEWLAWMAQEDDERSAEERAFIRAARGPFRGEVSLPPALVSRAARLLDAYPRKQLRPALERTSKKLWERSDSDPGVRVGWTRSRQGTLPFAYGPREALAYVAYRMFPAFTVARRVLDEVAARQGGDWAPRSVLDFGAGPGSALWAACGTWPDSVRATHGVEPSRAMTEAAEALCGEDLPGLRWSASLSAAEQQPADVVLASQVLSELPHDLARVAATQKLWELTAPGGVLVVIERGSPGGSHAVRSARQLVLSAEAAAGRAASVVAPCPHDGPCPMGKRTWCHFAQRVDKFDVRGQRSRGQTFERFSYVVLRRTVGGGVGSAAGEVHDESADVVAAGEVHDERALPHGKAVGGDDDAWARLIRQPLKRRGHVTMDLCTPAGSLERRVVSRAQLKDVPSGYTAARKSWWGGRWPA